MQQKYEIAFLQFSFAVICLAQPVLLVPYSNMEIDKTENLEESNKIQINSYNAVRPNKKSGMAEYSSSSQEYNKNENNFENFNVLQTTQNLTTSIENTDVPNTSDNDFLPLYQLMPDFTAEEYSEIHKEGATPWSFLKHIDDKKSVTVTQPDTTKNAATTRVYINIPIVINSDTFLPISLTIGEKNISIKETNGTTATSLPIKLKDRTETPNRETNRHRSGFDKKIYAQN